MPQITNTHGLYLQHLRMKVHNPSKVFITTPDEDAALNEAAINVASRLGGLAFIDRTLTTTAGQSDYTVSTSYRAIRYLEIADTSVTPNTITTVDVVRYEDFRRLNTPQASDKTYAYFVPETNNLHIEPAPATTGLQLWLLVWGMPNRIIAATAGQTSFATTLYDGDLAQLSAITTEAASLLRMKSRDLPESNGLHERANEATEAAAVVESMKNMISKAQVGRHTPNTNLRSF